MKPLFKLGRTVVTGGAAQVLPPRDVFAALSRHERGDWGEVGLAGREDNELALREGQPLVSAYKTARNLMFWIVTAADRSATTVLLPVEY